MSAPKTGKTMKLRKTKTPAQLALVIEGAYTLAGNEMVAALHQEAVTTSRIVAKVFTKQHKDVLRVIDKMPANGIPEEFYRRNFTPISYTDIGGREQREMLMTKKGWMYLVQSFTGKKAGEMKARFIDEFFRMEAELGRIKNQKANAEWIEARQSGKLGRREFTDTVKAFVDYAKEQGSKHADRYYQLLTQAEHKALFIVSEATGMNFRDCLTAKQLADLRVAEKIAENALLQCMNEKRVYQDGYKMAKAKLEEFAAMYGKQLPGSDSRPMLPGSTLLPTT